MKKLLVIVFCLATVGSVAQCDDPTPGDLRIAATYMEASVERRTERLWTSLILGGIGTIAILDDHPNSDAIGAGFFGAAVVTSITFEFVIIGKDRKAARALLHKPIHP